MGAHCEEQISVSDRFLRPGCHFRVGDEDDIVIVALKRIQSLRRFRTIERHAFGQTFFGIGSIQNKRLCLGGKHRGQLRNEPLWNRRAPCADDRDGSRPRVWRGGFKGCRRSQPLSQRARERAPDALVFRRKLIEFGATEP